MKTGSSAASIDIHVGETAAVQTLLNVPLSGQRVVPTHLQQVILLLLINSQACTGHCKLNYKHQEQDDHVKEQQDLMVLHGTNESSKSNKEEENPNSYDATNHLETGHQPETLPPCGDADHQQTHHNIKDVERTQGILGAGESSAAHLDYCFAEQKL